MKSVVSSTFRYLTLTMKKWSKIRNELELEWRKVKIDRGFKKVL